MKAYVRTLEAIIASTMIATALILSLSALLRYREIGTYSHTTAASTVRGALEYLALKGELNRIIYEKQWNELKERLDNTLVTAGIGYDLHIYSVSDELTEITNIVSYYNPHSTFIETVYYYVPPAEEGGEGYLIEINVCR